MTRMKKRINLRTTISTLAIVLLFVFITIYSISRTRSLVRGVSLEVEGIENGKTYEEEELTIKGKAIRAKHIEVNGYEININDEGNFSHVVVLSPGYNFVGIRAEDRFGKEKNITYQIIYQN